MAIKRTDGRDRITALPGEIDQADLKDLADRMFGSDEDWTVRYDKQGIRLLSRKGLFGGITSIKYSAVFEGRLDKARLVMYDRMLEHMPAWSREFISGDVLDQGAGISGQPYQVLKTRFRTPFFMKHREYVFYFSLWEVSGTFYVFYRSVADQSDPGTDKGFVRAKLYPTIYRFRTEGEGNIRIDHTLSTDLGGDMKLSFQNSAPVVNGMVKANVRDCRNLMQLISS